MNTCNILKLCNRRPHLAILHSSGISRAKQSVDILTKIADTKLKEKRLLKVAIIGVPNSGKSTLINQIVQRTVFPISKKVHTTRFSARAILNHDDTQIVFLDTPGLVTVTESKKYDLKPEFVSGGEDAIIEADIISVVHDLSNHYTRNYLDPKVLRLLHLYKNKESILILNKVDTLKSKSHILDITTALTHGKINFHHKVEDYSLSEKNVQDLIKSKKQWENFSQIFMVSALLGDGISDIKDYFLNAAKIGDWIFPENEFTDQKPVHIIEEVIRAKLLENLPEEVPYKLKVELEYLDMDDEELIRAVVLIRCESKRIENLVKGSGGARIRNIAVEAEQSLSDSFHKVFHLRVILSTNEF